MRSVQFSMRGFSTSRMAFSTSSKVLKQHEPHFRLQAKDSLLPHPIWSRKEVEEVKMTHVEPTKFVDKLALMAAKFCRTELDLLSGYTLGFRKEKHLLK